MRKRNILTFGLSLLLVLSPILTIESSARRATVSESPAISTNDDPKKPSDEELKRVLRATQLELEKLQSQVKAGDVLISELELKSELDEKQIAQLKFQVETLRDTVLLLKDKIQSLEESLAARERQVKSYSESLKYEVEKRERAERKYETQKKMTKWGIVGGIVIGILVGVKVAK